MQVRPNIRIILALVLLALALGVSLGAVSAQDRVPTVIVRSVTQAERPTEYETTRLVVGEYA